MALPMTASPSSMAVVPLVYQSDSTGYFAQLVNRPYAVFLDSGYPRAYGGRYDILSADPEVVLTTRGTATEVLTATENRITHADPFALLREYLTPWTPPIPELPFAGGAIGYFAYDLARRIEYLPQQTVDDQGLPEMVVGLYRWVIVVDHLKHRAYLVGRPPEAVTQRLGAVRHAAPVLPELRGEIRCDTDRSHYERAFARVMDYLHAGDVYQVNLAQRFSANGGDVDPWTIYQRLRRQAGAPFGAYLSTPKATLLSASPERFLKVCQGQVMTQPIKGTRPRSASVVQDQALAQVLAISDKDRAENLMIVDLMRNDLGRVCATGSIKVPALFKLQSFTHVHHLVSTVTGRLAAGRDALDVLRACLPGGSVTGAPKLRAMAIIEELEGFRRGVYCGAIGYIGFDGAMDTSIAIRTATWQDHTLRYWAGGAIVADSVCDAEYQETLDKAQVFRSLFRGTP